MPVLRVWEADDVVVFKRSMASGCAGGSPNRLFHRDNTAMLLGDATARVEDVLIPSDPSSGRDPCHRYG